MTVSNEVWVCSAGETFDSVALAYYGDEKYASEMMSVNPLLCGRFSMRGGEIMELPVIETEDEDTQTVDVKAPWKE